jgi:lysophospholipase L1-like esterase
MAFAVKPGQSVLFIGDSITDCGRRGAEAPMGSGYVRQVRDLIVARYPAHQVQIINKGIGGNTVRDLTHRFTDDCIRHQPDWVSVKIGINDIHRWLRNVPETSVTPEEFDQMYEALLVRLKKETKAGIILVDPFYISRETCPDSFRAGVLEHLPRYLGTVHRLVRKYKTRHVRTHEVFAKLLKHYEPDLFCPEPVHPNLTGHLVIADAWMKAMGS